MGIEVNGNSGRPAQTAHEAGKSQTSAPANNSARGNAGAKLGSNGGDQVQVSNQAAQMRALETEIANLPVVDTQRVQDVQRTLATGAFQVEPAQVADKLLSFEAGLGREA